MMNFSHLNLNLAQSTSIAFTAFFINMLSYLIDIFSSKSTCLEGKVNTFWSLHILISVKYFI